MNIQLQNKWLEQYNEIYRAIANLQDDFEDCENVFGNVLASLEYSTVLELCLDDAVDDLISDIACDIEDGVPHIYTFRGQTTLDVTSEPLIYGKGKPTIFDEGKIVTLSLYQYGNNTNNLSVIITDNKTGVKYYVVATSLGDLIQ